MEGIRGPGASVSPGGTASGAPDSRPTRAAGRKSLALLALGGFLLIAAIVVASRPYGQTLKRASPSLVLAAPVVDLLLGSLAGLAVLSWLLIVLSLMTRTPAREREERGRNTLLSIMLQVAPLLIIAGVAAWAIRAKKKIQLLPAFPLAPPSLPSQQPVPAAGVRFSSPDWSMVTIIALLFVALVIVAYLLLTRKKAGRPGEVSSDDAAEVMLAAAVDDALESLSRETDARRAVIAAYSSMEETMARAGYGRRLFEAPVEYLSRVLKQLDAAEVPLSTLTDLFERAKFSKHEIDEAMRLEAIKAVRALRPVLRTRRGSAAL